MDKIAKSKEELERMFEDKLGDGIKHLVYKDDDGNYALDSIFCAFEGFKMAWGFEEDET